MQYKIKKLKKLKWKYGSTSLKVIMKGEGKEADRTEKSNVPSLQAFMEWLNTKIDSGEVDVEIVENSPNAFTSTLENLIAYVPTILLIVLIIMVFKMQGLGGDSGKVYGGDDGKKSKVKFADVAGLEEEKGELVEIVDFLKKPDEYIKMGARIPRGILLYGKPRNR